ncbi:hypothetical protein COU05_01860 [bacterium (Candidatus Gribaldobacteria) CG10_big_fil_rev_8_21_14_0_10_37_21]|uniref:Uncharacterized protein n=1 Tax=bacterium (Candidatus Gribaldobacteria) CG10_big_fil_rev_8_21_14_0_10_37_21 TaxID=2014275 RepID=A0A2H0UUF1_9BACT|nr:MAG: hypothetical protein AUJ25_00060 [Parcubacteria group bacterium CG1_02_37_13]PIR90482.1 MAG: hypothetical protein COU05_01860 [bacterium (Candidatus Gribaldobacteria) CG10_big_fil_rev_8_21_14_0_10_37_21]
MLSKEQTKAISEISANVGHIFFGSVALPFWLKPQGLSGILMVFTGLFIAICFWVASIKLIK